MMSRVGRRSWLQGAPHAVLKRTALAADRLQPSRRGITVLAYHRVGRRTAIAVDLPTWLFEEQMERLTAGPRVIDLDAAVACLAHPEPPAEDDPVAVTFDDGTADFVDEALPVLVRYQVPATLYLATAFVEEQRSFPDDGTPVSWSGLADALSTGLITIGSHTHRHALLDRLPAEAVSEELDRSIDLISDRLGVTARHFAYPKALPPTPAADRAVRARFASAALAGTRPNPYGGTDPYRLARSPLQVADGLRYFGAKVHGGMRLEDDVRRLVGRRRYAGATT
jgi:peptidoglycan/xylan/chitin deacetylase (PgdA/CDA1 family)